MSQVIPNQVLQVGQTMRLSSKEDVIPLGRSLHQACPNCPSVSPTCCSYSTDRWVSQPMKILSQHGGRSTQNSGHHRISDKHGDSDFLAHRVLSGSYLNAKSHRTQVFSASGQQRAEQGSVVREREREMDKGNPLSPTLDVSIDNLNQLILELDPSFQPIPVRSGTANHSNSRESSSKKSERPTQGSHEDVDASKVLLVSRGTSPFRSSDHSITSTASSGVPVPRSPKDSSCSTSGSLIFSSSPSQRGDSGGPTAQHTSHSSCSSSAPPHSPGSDSWPKHLHTHRQRMSGASLLSTSPGSDTSYILGSAHSLLSEDADSPVRKLFGSSGSFSNLSSPYSYSPDLQKTYFSDQNLEVFNSQSQHPSSIRSFKGQKSVSPPHLRGHPSSCPPSVNGSMVDIPVVLINGSPEQKNSVIPDSQNSHSSGRLGHRPTMKKSCKASSPSVVNGQSADVQPTIKFVMDTSKFWFKPHISRDQADAYLKDQEPGSFIVRDSTSYRGAFGLAMKVDEDQTSQLPPSRSDGTSSDLIRHYLIESSAKGVRLKGALEEPYFGSLSAWVYQHAITKLDLPRKLLMPTTDFAVTEEHREDTSATQENKKPAACNLLYLNSVNTESLTGPLAVQKAVSATFETDPLPVPTIVSFKVSHKGIIVTDIQRKLFFRRHYPANTLSYCGIDPKDRRWQKHCRSARIFGFVAKCQDLSQENVCHLFAEYDSTVLPIELVRGLMKNVDTQ
ncbi:tensin-4-like isoform X1 [Acipenser oxyrinchus oxyrinchus]|uniref:Tensin-4-like isoform X1 n=1 Tax=Acipenser oxyrinchus oxyrinchus TaxID=40147 RepID=A0AAD8CYJ0_ACIOX|nr:tensin-4-like isoform X1 [Acipenser oxyrinchus oxyrinchus]